MSLSRAAAGFVLVFLIPLVTFSQEETRRGPNVETVRYPPLARQARIQGDVRLRSGPDGIGLVSGHPLLAPRALENFKEVTADLQAEIEGVYHFVLVNDTEVRFTKTTVKKGNRFTRLILRAFAMKTENIVESRECSENPERPMNRIDVTENRIEVWIYASHACVQVSASQIASL